MKYKKLKNGGQFIHHQTDTDIVHLAVFIKVGTKDEQHYPAGIAHFTEHMIFKGTQHHHAQDILRKIDEFGGEFNAYTTKSYTAYGVKTLKRFEEEAIQLLLEIIFYSTFPKEEIEKEQKVILEEIKMVEDDPEETLFEQFEAEIFNKTSLKQTILGSKSSLQEMNQQNLLQFHNQYYVSNNCIFSYSGTKSEMIASMIEALPENEIPKHQNEFNYQKIDKVIHKPHLEQAHVVLAHPIVSHHHHLYEAFQVINQIYGGSMNALLFKVLREQNGYCYHTYSSIETYDDGGILYTYFATDKENINACIECINEIIKQLHTTIDETTVEKTKQNMITNLYMNFDNDGQFVNHYGKSMLIYDKIYTLDEIENLIDKVTLEDIQNALNYIDCAYSQMKIMA